MTLTQPTFVGIDIGGTATRFAAIGETGDILKQSQLQTATVGAGDPDERIDHIATEVRRIATSQAHVMAIGIGATGPVDPLTGEIHNPATLPAFSEIRLAEHLANRLGCPVHADNDAVAAALGEYASTTHGRPERLLMITLGTGIGGALLINGTPFRGSTGTHPEIGHIPIFGDNRECYCGLPGCWEPHASRHALQLALRDCLDREHALADVLDAAAQRYATDRHVRDVFHDYGTRVGRGLACLQVVYAPTTIVIGGGALPYLPLFQQGIQSALTQDSAYTPPARIVAATLGEYGGAIGAAFLAYERAHQRASSVGDEPR